MYSMDFLLNAFKECLASVAVVCSQQLPAITAFSEIVELKDRRFRVLKQVSRLLGLLLCRCWFLLHPPKQQVLTPPLSLLYIAAGRGGLCLCLSGQGTAHSPEPSGGPHPIGTEKGGSSPAMQPDFLTHPLCPACPSLPGSC
jgi:hypothetical protein